MFTPFTEFLYFQFLVSSFKKSNNFCFKSTRGVACEGSYLNNLEIEMSKSRSRLQRNDIAADMLYSI
jgi:hypothetical protein